MPTWQVVSGLITLGLVAWATDHLRKSRRPSTILFVALVVPIPAAGFAVYAAFGGPTPELTAVTLLSLVLCVIGLYPAFYGRRALQRLRTMAPTPAQITYVNRHILAARLGLLLGISGFLYGFEPWFAVANVAAIAAWAAIWAPKRQRTRRLEVSAEVGASPETTLQFLAEPSNWPRYQSDLEELTVQPDGPLVVGSEVKAQRRFTAGTGEPPWPQSIVWRSTISAITRSSFTAVLSDRAGTLTTDVEQAGSGSRITGRSEWVVPFTNAVLGLALELDRDIEAGRLVAKQNFEKLNAELAGTVD